MNSQKAAATRLDTDLTKATINHPDVQGQYRPSRVEKRQGWQGPDVEASVVDLQLVALVALHHYVLVLLVPLKLPCLQGTAPGLFEGAAAAMQGCSKMYGCSGMSGVQHMS